MAQAVTEIEENTAAAWIRSGAIRVTEYGSENTYYINEFDHQFYCKNYPQRWGLVE